MAGPSKPSGVMETNVGAVTGRQLAYSRLQSPTVGCELGCELGAARQADKRAAFGPIKFVNWQPPGRQVACLSARIHGQWPSWARPFQPIEREPAGPSSGLTAGRPAARAAPNKPETPKPRRRESEPDGGATRETPTPGGRLSFPGRRADELSMATGCGARGRLTRD